MLAISPQVPSTMTRGRSSTATSTAAFSVETPLVDSTGIASRVQKRRRTSFRKQNSPPKRAKHEHQSVEPPVISVEPVSEEINTNTSPGPARSPTPNNRQNNEAQVDTAVIEDGESDEVAQAQDQEVLTETDLPTALPQLDGSVEQSSQIAEVEDKPGSQILDEEETALDHTNVPTLVSSANSDETTSGTLTSSPQFTDPDGYLVKRVISTLDHAAEGVLDTFLDLSSNDMHQLITHANTTAFKVWTTLLDLFGPYRRLYSGKEAYITPSDFVGFPSTAYTTLYKANLATAISSLLNPTPTNLTQLHDQFLEIFVRPEGRMVEWQSIVLHELKTQLCIARIQENKLPIYSALNDIFPGNIEQLFRQQGLGFNGPHLSPTEITFLNQCSQTRQHFQGAGSLEAIECSYTWIDFVHNISRHLKPHVEIVLGRPPQQTSFNNATSQNTQNHPSTKSSDPVNTSTNYVAVDDDLYNDDDILRSATLAAHAAMGGQGFSTPTLEVNRDNPDGGGKRNRNFEPLSAQELNTQATTSAAVQHTSTQEQYEKARIAATARAAAKNKANSGSQSHRRPWTPEEENALMKGLDEVKGPHWSQILLMYGPGGRISEILKDRNQVQLKDKARNLKLFFLKSGREVPASLREVTGELKTRAPQAAKNDMSKDASADEAEAENGDVMTTNEDNEATQQSSATPELEPATLEQQKEVPPDESPQKEVEEDQSMAEAIQQAMEAVNATNALQIAS